MTIGLNEPRLGHRKLDVPGGLRRLRPLRATRPARWLVYVTLGTLLSGPPPLGRLAGRDPSVALAIGSGLDTTAMAQGALVAVSSAVGLLLLMRPDVRRHLRPRIAGSKHARMILTGLALWIVLSSVSAVYSISRAYTAFEFTKYLGICALLLVLLSIGRDAFTPVRFLLVYNGFKMMTIVAFVFIDPGLVIAANGRLTGSPLLPDYGFSGLIVVACYGVLHVYHRGATSRLADVESRATLLWRSSRSLSRAISRLNPLVVLAPPTMYVLLSQTRSTIWPLIGLLLLLMWFCLSRTMLVATLLLFALVGAFIATENDIARQGARQVLARGQSNILQLSDRDNAFEHTVKWGIDRNPILGSGFGAGSRSAMVEYSLRTNPGLAAPHDPFSAVFADLGLFGSVIQAALILLLLPVLFHAIRRNRREPEVAALALLAAFFVARAIPEGAELVSEYGPLGILFACAYLSKFDSARPTRAQRRNETLSESLA